MPMHHIDELRAGLSRHKNATREPILRVNAVNLGAGACVSHFSPGLLMSYSSKVSEASRFTTATILSINRSLDQLNATTTNTQQLVSELQGLRAVLVEFDQTLRFTLSRLRSIVELTQRACHTAANDQ